MFNRFKKKPYDAVEKAKEAVDLFGQLIDGMSEFIDNPDVQETINNLTHSKNLIDTHLNQYLQESSERNKLLLMKALEACPEGDRQLDLLKKKLQQQMAEESNSTK